MRHLAQLATLAAVTALVSLAVTAAAQTDNDEAPTLEFFERFNGTLGVTALSAAPAAQPGTVQQRRLVIRNWIIPGGLKVDRFQVEGFAVIQLRGGELVTVIDGERKERQEDEFWTIPAGSYMSIETEDDSAILQTIAVR